MQNVTSENLVVPAPDFMPCIALPDSNPFGDDHPFSAVITRENWNASYVLQKQKALAAIPEDIPLPPLGRLRINVVLIKEAPQLQQVREQIQLADKRLPMLVTREVKIPFWSSEPDKYSLRLTLDSSRGPKGEMMWSNKFKRWEGGKFKLPLLEIVVEETPPTAP